nr:DUF4436 family protein [Mycobacterium vicinigordonae]
MSTTIYLYVEGSRTHRIPPIGTPTNGSANVTLDIQSIHNDYSELVCDLAVSPAAGMLDPATHGLKQSLTVTVTSTTVPTTRTWTVGMLPGVIPVPLTLARDTESWPLDRYFSGPVTVELYLGNATNPERARVTFVDRLAGWQAQIRPAADDQSAAYTIDLERSASTIAFAAVILCILIAIATQALFVAVQTLRGRRPFQAPMTTWYAAMLFAVVPLRNALPGSPAFGSWVDLTIVLWVLVALVVSMLLYIASWWRQLKPAH